MPRATLASFDSNLCCGKLHVQGIRCESHWVRWQHHRNWSCLWLNHPFWSLFVYKQMLTIAQIPSSAWRVLTRAQKDEGSTQWKTRREEKTSEVNFGSSLSLGWFKVLPHLLRESPIRKMHSAATGHSKVGWSQVWSTKLTRAASPWNPVSGSELESLLLSTCALSSCTLSKGIPMVFGAEWLALTLHLCTAEFIHSLAT